MSSKGGLNSLDDDIENQRDIDPPKDRSEIIAEVSVARPSSSTGAASTGGLERTEASRVTQDITVGDATNTFSVVFAVANKLSFDDSSIDNYDLS